ARQPAEPHAPPAPRDRGPLYARSHPLRSQRPPPHRPPRGGGAGGDSPGPLLPHGLGEGARGLSRADRRARGSPRDAISTSPGGNPMRAFVYKLRPSRAQKAHPELTLETCRRLYDRALAERTDAWEQERRSLGFAQQCATLPAQKETSEFLSLVHSQVL